MGRTIYIAVKIETAPLHYLRTVAVNAWSVTIPSADLQALGQGSQTVTAEISNIAGTPAVLDSVSVEVDTLAPDAVITGFADVIWGLSATGSRRTRRRRYWVRTRRAAWLRCSTVADGSGTCTVTIDPLGRSRDRLRLLV